VTATAHDVHGADHAALDPLNHPATYLARARQNARYGARVLRR
jgi:hypothetical protein